MEQNNNLQTTEQTINDGKTIAIISYLTLIGLVIAIVMNTEKKNPFATFHLRQTLGLFVTGVALGIVGIIPILGWIVSILGSLAMIVFWIMGIISAINGKETPIPLLGKHYQKWFATVNI